MTSPDIPLLQNVHRTSPTEPPVASGSKIPWGRQRHRTNSNPISRERAGGSRLKGNTVQVRIVYNDPSAGSVAEDRHKIDLETLITSLSYGFIPSQPPVPISNLINLHIHLRIQDPSSCDLELIKPPVFSNLIRFTYVGDPKYLEELFGISWDRSFPELKDLKICGPTGTKTFRKILSGCPKLRSLFVNSLSREDFEYIRSPMPLITHEALERLDVSSDIDLHFATQNLNLESLEKFRLWMSPKAAALLEACHIGIVHGDWNLYLHFPVDKEFCDEMEEREIRVQIR